MSKTPLSSGPQPEADEPSGTEPWTPDCGDGTYRNPVLFADYSDPDAIRVGEDFYLIGSSFNCTPGLPILHSRDLVNWTLINHGVKNLPHLRYAEVQHGCGIWASSIRYHAKKFWIVFPLPDEGLYVITADHPASQWTEPRLLLAGKGLIDPCPLWDDDGGAYIAHAYAGSRAGTRNKLHVRPVTPDLQEITGPGRIVAQIDENLPALEGPKFYKRNGWYYISAPSGGVASGWQVIFRSRDIYGPYEQRIALAQRGTSINGPHQGALLDTPGGEWWFLHFQDAGLYGRIVHLQPVRWVDDWPLIGVNQDEEGVGKPVLRHRKPEVGKECVPSAPPTTDDFQGPQLGLQWQWHANHDDQWYSLSERRRCLRLYPQFVPGSDFRRVANLLLQKFPARRFAMETALEIPAGHRSVHAGLIVMGKDYAALDLSRVGDGYKLQLLTNCDAKMEYLLPGGSPVRLGVIVSSGGACQLGLPGKDGDFFQIGPEFFARPGFWIGAKIGLYCLSRDMLDMSGHADFPYFKVGNCIESARSAPLELDGAPAAHHGTDGSEVPALLSGKVNRGDAMATRAGHDSLEHSARNGAA